MSLMYKLIQEGRNQERKKIAQDLLGLGVEKRLVKEVTGLSEQELKRLIINDNLQLIK